MTIRNVLGLSALFVLSAVSAAEAHVGAGSVSGAVSGFGHPIGGLDHVLAMVAVGVLAAQQGGRGLWLIPASFVAMMVVGGALGVSGVAVPFVEQGIVGSVVILGGVVALGRAMPLGAAMALVGALSVFHGHAHGTEMPVDASGVQYALGFAVATAALHLAGIGAAVALERGARRIAPTVVRIVGGGVATVGMAMLAGA